MKQHLLSGVSNLAIVVGVDGYGKAPQWSPRDFVEEDRRKREQRSFENLMRRIRGLAH